MDNDPTEIAPRPYEKSQTYRRIVQSVFLALVILIGVQFTVFVHQLQSGRVPTIPRPPGVESFLPISSLISLKYWITSGVVNRVHPAGLIIFVIILLTALLLKRGFCSWVCPFGLLSEYLNRLHVLIFKRPLKLSRWLDVPLRSLKYLLLAFFLWAVIGMMNIDSLAHFIYSPYNMVADIKMLYFFTEISPLALRVLAALLILSVLIRNFWCRYLCPYGALLGVLSLFSPLKIRRNAKTCTQCKSCTRICPADITVHNAVCVRSDECHACLMCARACPEESTLGLSLPGNSGRIHAPAFAVIICALFIGGSMLGRATGYWQNGISINEYRFHVSHRHMPLYQHSRGQVAVYDKDAWLKMMEQLRDSGLPPGDAQAGQGD